MVSEHYDVNISKDITNEPDITLYQEDKGDVTTNYEFQLMLDKIHYDHTKYRYNIGKIANILNTLIKNKEDNPYMIQHFQVINKDVYNGLPIEDVNNGKIYFIKTDGG